MQVHPPFSFVEHGVGAAEWAQMGPWFLAPLQIVAVLLIPWCRCPLGRLFPFDVARETYL